MDQPTDKSCPQCHQPILAAYYFCPNCGHKLKQPPLATSSTEQMRVYVHSIVLPFLAFITINKWRGILYLRSADPKARQIGVVASAFLVLSTAFVVWYTISLARSFSESIVENMNAGFGGY